MRFYTAQPASRVSAIKCGKDVVPDWSKHPLADPNAKAYRYLLDMAKQVAKITKNVERPDTLCVPADVFMDISTRRIPDTSTTVLAFIQEHAPYIKNVVSTAELDADSPETNPYAVGGNPQGVAFLFKNDPRKLTLENPMPFYQYPLQVEKLETIILCEARTAGVIVYYPLSALIAVGVS